MECTVGERLAASGRTLATAESCSGGLIAHRLTNVPGASDYFLGGFVAYSNDAKAELLGVAARDIEAHGAVSEAVARQMAEGALERLGADFGIGVTGIAGPAGGTLEKPVGLVYIAVAGRGETVVVRNEFAGARDEIKWKTAEKALTMLLECIG